MAQDKDKFRGILSNQEIDPALTWRDPRSLKQKFSDYMGTPDGFIMVMGIVGALFVIFPAFGEIWGLVGIWMIRYAAKKEFRLPFRIPKTSGLLDPGQPNPATDKPDPAEGITFFGNERKTKKELWFNNSDMRTHVLIFGSTGAGKALRMDEVVHTPTGWKKNKDLKLGDEVSTPFGKSAIVGIYPQGNLQLYKVTFHDGREIEVSGDHLWEVHHQGWKKSSLEDGTLVRAKVITTEELMKELASAPLHKEYYVPLCNEVEKPEQSLAIAPYFVGAMLGDGQITSPALLKEIKQWDGVANSIPPAYKDGSIEQRYQLLQGLMDTQGCIHKGKVEFSTSFEDLAADVAEVLRSLGAIVHIRPEVSGNTSSEGSPTSYCLEINHPAPGKLFSLERKKKEAGLQQNNEDLSLRVLGVEKTTKLEECQCIKLADKRGLFITKDYIVTHNTETLLSLAYNALVQGSGLIYVDGKGENVLYTKVFAMARTMGREDDILCINYMTGSRDVFGPQEKKLSNTLNPFSSGGSGGLTELLVSLMDDGGSGGDMWKGRAISLISAIMMALTYMRDQKEILLDVDAIREYLILDNIIKLYKTRRDFPNHIRAALRAYLVSLPGFQESAPKQNDTVLEQHGYLQMQFTKLLGSLSDQYGFIFKTNLGEVDFKDVVLNRRILVVLLPALEKSTDELANLGKIIVACLKQMMAQALGSTVEGTYAEVVETKPTNSEMPFMTVLDEYGYYAVKGSAVMPAQARSLGFSMIFAGQDLPAFEKASKEEAASIVANCNVKICMKLEDPKDTYELFEKAAAEALVSNVGVLEMSTGGIATTFKPGSNASVENRKRINMLDLREQREGEAHIIFKSAVIRAKMFYASPPKPPRISMNYFVRVEPPDVEIINQLDNGLKSLIKNIGNEMKIKELEENLDVDSPNITSLRSLFDEHASLSPSEAAFAAVTSLGVQICETYDEKIGSIKQQMESDEDDEDEEEAINIFSKKDYERNHDKGNKPHNMLQKKDVEDDIDDDDEDMEEDDDINVFMEESEVRKGFENIEKMIGSSDEEAKEAASRTVEDMKKVSRYPSEGKPSAKDPEEIMDILNELDEMFDLDDEENS